MCGRTAQSRHAVRLAAQILGAPPPRESYNDGNDDGDGENEEEYGWTDNFNLSPGMGAMVFSMDDRGNLQCSFKKWGLVTRHGTKKNPTPEGMNQHFENLMYNARTDTLWDKVTFRSLLEKRRTCLVAVDGFFEWKAELKGKKQPYYVHRKQSDRPFLLMPGLWTSVKTGREDEPTLDTFTILTTEACPTLEWLHSRMPVCIWQEELGKQWLKQPSVSLQRQLERGAAHSREEIDLNWHPVTPDMTSLKFRSDKAVAPLKRSSVKSFFAVQPPKNTPTNNNSPVKPPKAVNHPSSPPIKTIHTTPVAKMTVVAGKRNLKDSPTKASTSSTSKRTKYSLPSSKKGSIANFFAPKARVQER